MKPGTWQALALRQFQRAGRELATVLDGLDAQAVNIRSSELPNSIGWTAWHLTRGIDRNLSEAAGWPQLWTTDDWARQFGRTSDPSDTGFGHREEDVIAFQSPSPNILLAYHTAVQELAEHYLSSAPDTDGLRRVESPTLGNVHTVEERLAALLADTFAHMGQLTVLRSLNDKGPRAS
ncbi:hypothetical protein GCM10010331_70550 [Streptomyces xanthochromogenes]|uniref:DinB family protein n=1 Tax=Streptomyces xanthochromogenes TaxID=67384 RepID=UPI001675EABB|nr:DinB family protein [Streptomyces xanthochromogenes]GHB72309.1 hypothetical protein GCM10010331_70550 [Streptomyces xanthochromogenes]